MKGKSLQLLPRVGSPLRPLIIFGLSRLWFACLLSFFARYFTREQTGRGGPFTPDYWTAVMTWDADWYLAIANLGYPDKLEYGTDGVAEKSEWAFYPLWPMICRAVGDLTGLPFYMVAGFLTLILGGGAAVLLYRLFQLWNLPETTSLLILIFIFFSPMGVVFSLAYTESLALLLLAWLLILIQTQKYGLALIPILLLGLTRPILLAVALALAIYFIHRARTDRECFTLRERMKLGGTIGWTGFCFGLWPLIVGIRFQNALAYLEIQEAWRQYFGPSIVVWLATSPGENLLITAGIVAGFGLLGVSLWQGKKAGWPPLLISWVIGYAAFLAITIPATAAKGGVGVFYPSILRYAVLALIPLVPLAWLLNTSQRKDFRFVLAGSVILTNVVLTLLYLRYFVVMEPPVLYFWP